MLRYASFLVLQFLAVALATTVAFVYLPHCTIIVSPSQVFSYKRGHSLFRLVPRMRCTHWIVFGVGLDLGD